MKSKTDGHMTLLLGQQSVLGPLWTPIYEQDADFLARHVITAMTHLIREPNINSTVILRADILEEIAFTDNGEVASKTTANPDLPEFPSSAEAQETQILHGDLDDIRLREAEFDQTTVNLRPASLFIRRIIPRNPYKDPIINQTCLILKNESSVLVVYTPHITLREEVPFYLPPVQSVGILLHGGRLSIHYVPFAGDTSLHNIDPAERPIRIALRLLNTLAKHSRGVKAGYEKRVNHDVVVPRIAFQNRYIALKKTYLADLVANWVESTDPKKHVFEDLAVAAFLIELWSARYPKKDFQFVDMGCGNGLLVHILISEGYTGKGVDARARKSWRTYPAKVQECLHEQIIIPSVLLKPHPAMVPMAHHITDNGRLFQVPELHGNNHSVPLMKYYSSANLLELSLVCTTEDFASNTFLIGNHLDELTCWLPLLNFPFMVIPCCLHALSGAKVRFHPRPKHNGTQNVSTYGALVDHVEDLALLMGWVAEKEVLRIPSTRNTAIIGIDRKSFFDQEEKEATELRVFDILAAEGGAEGWVENLMLLMKRNPKNH